MGCTYSDFNGKCTLCDEDGEPPFDAMGEENGNCVCEDDPDPSASCCQYESDGNDENEDDEFEEE